MEGLVMDPTTNDVFSHDYENFVLQRPIVISRDFYYQQEIKANFSEKLAKAEKNKKDPKKKKEEQKEGLQKPFT
jgi:hypothetical protein